MSRRLQVRRARVLAGVVVATVCVADATPASPPSTRAQDAIRFVDATDSLDPAFRHHHGGTGEKQLPEIMGGGAAWLDFDLDGAADLYLVDSGVLLPAADPGSGGGPAGVSAAVPANMLLRGAPGGRLTLVPEDAGAADRGYGMGVAVADFDGDGWPDLFVTNFGANALYRNNGDGSFSNVTAAAGLGDEGWATSAAWGDLDADGAPDLYVANYLDYDAGSPRVCGQLDGVRRYCRPAYFDGVGDVLYRNRGDGTFANVAEQAGVVNPAEGKGLGVVIADLVGDELPDVYVANDGTRNFLFENKGDFRFEDIGLFSGTGLSAGGRAEAGMGVDAGDLDGDGLAEIVVTNFADEANSLYRGHAPGFFIDETFSLGLGGPSLVPLSFGIVMADFDGDGDRDLAVVNGHVEDTFPDWEQPNQIYENRLDQLRSGAAIAATGEGVVDAEDPARPSWRPRQGLFADVSATAGEPIARTRVSRGLALGDIDADGWPDLVVTNVNGPAELLLNVSPAANERLVIRLRGRRANRDALGAKVRVVPTLSRSGESRGPAQFFQIKGGASYVSHSTRDLHIGLGDFTGADVEIEWPGGTRDVVEDVSSGQVALIVEGHGMVAARSLGTRAVVGGTRR